MHGFEERTKGNEGKVFLKSRNGRLIRRRKGVRKRKKLEISYFINHKLST